MKHLSICFHISPLAALLVNDPQHGTRQPYHRGALDVDTYEHLSVEGAEMVLHKARGRMSSGSNNGSKMVPAACEYDANALVLWWFNGIFGPRGHHDYGYPSCDVSCVEAGSHERCADRADAIVYHLPTHGQGPDFKNKFSIGFSMEAYPALDLITVKPAGYDMAATTNLDSDVPILYIGAFKTYDTWRTSNVPTFTERLPAAAFMAKNCAADRAALVSRLAELGVPVHSLGSCAPPGTEAKYTKEIAEGDKVSFINKYRVYLAFENTVQPGYVTEKIFDGYKAGCVQAYRGAPDIDKFVPPNSMIRVPDSIDDEEGMADAAAKIKAALNDVTTWDQLNGWKRTPVSEWNGGDFLRYWGVPDQTPPVGFFAGSSCRMCRAAYANKYPDRARFDRKTQSLEFVNQKA